MSVNKDREELKLQKEEFLQRLQEAFGGEDYLEKQKAEAAANLGLNPDDIQVKMDVLATTMSREGVLAKVHVGRTRFSLQLNEKDLGLRAVGEDHKDFLNEYVKLGSKFLINGNYIRKMDKIESAARRSVEAHGFRTQWGVFVPYVNTQKLGDEINRLREEYFVIRDEIVARYDLIRAETARAYRAAAIEAVHRGGGSLPDNFVDNFVEMAMSAFPGQQRIYDSFYMDLEIGFVPLTSFIEEERARIRLTEERERIYKEELENIEETARLDMESKLSQENYKREQIKQIHREALESYKRQVDGFFNDVVGQTYGIVYEAVTAVNANLVANGSLTAGDTKRLRTLINRLEKLNFMNDEQVSSHIGKLSSIINTPVEARDPGEIKKAIDQIATQSRQVLTLLGCTPRTARGKEAIDANINTAPVERVQRKARNTGKQEPLFRGMETEPMRKKRVV